MDYTKFNVEDLASDDSFVSWVLKQDPEAGQYWDLFLSVHPEMKDKIAEARNLLLTIRHAEVTVQNPKQIDALWESIEYGITAEENKVHQKPKIRSLIWYSAAAVISLVLLYAGVQYGVFESQKNGISNFESLPGTTTQDFIEEVNTTGNVLRVHLNDGSVIDLENNSRIKYKRNYTGAASRDVILIGEAFFTVAKDPRQPFLVHANEVVTKVIGTSFRVKAHHQEKDIVVSVITGKVSVYSAKDAERKNFNSDELESEKSGVVLLPNQEVTYQRDQQSFDRTLIADPVVVVPAITTNDFTFEDASINDVFRLLEEAYGIEIIFDEDVMQKCYITAPLGSEPLFEKLKIICRTIGATYEIIDAKVIINSSGC